MADLTVTARSAAPRDVVWDVLVDSEGWAGWADFSDSVRTAEGRGHPDGVGAVREVWVGGVSRTRERVEVFDPEGGLYEYSLVGGPPLKDYRGRVRLADDGGGTRIEWRATFRPPLPLPGADLATGTAFRLVLGRITRDLAREAERRTRA